MSLAPAAAAPEIAAWNCANVATSASMWAGVGLGDVGASESVGAGVGVRVTVGTGDVDGILVGGNDGTAVGEQLSQPLQSQAYSVSMISHVYAELTATQYSQFPP